MFDIVVSGGKIVDGSGKPAFQSDVGIKGDRIAGIGDLTDASAETRIDANGGIVAPGFIDLHTHSDFTLLVNGAAESQVHQGITLEVLGQCGYSPAPIDDPELGKSTMLGYHPSVEIDWNSFDRYLTRLEQTDLGLNVLALVGHNTVFQTVMKGAMHSPSSEEVKAMARLVEVSLEEGAAGFSTGLEYMPGCMARPEEILPLIEVTKRYDALYATHVRNRDQYYDLGFAEALAAARITGVKLQISHIQPKFGAPPRAMAHTLEMIRWARETDADVAFDIIPHDWNHTSVLSVIPSWAFEGGTDKLRRRLGDPETREEMKKNPKPIWQLVPAGRWNDIVLFRSKSNKDLIGLTFEEIGKRRDADPYDAVFDILLEEGRDLQGLMWASHGFSESDIRLCIRQPECGVISDTMALAPYGVLEDSIGSLSGYGWIARLFQKYVREEAIIGLEDAVHKVTGLPAARLGLSDRGRLSPGAMADIVIFDLDRIENRATLMTPTRYPAGIEYVLVNGKIVMANGHRTAVNSGRVIRRTHR